MLKIGIIGEPGPFAASLMAGFGDHMLKIGIIGEQCAGKTTVAELVSNHIGRCGFVKFAGPIYQTIAALGGKKNRKFMQEFSDVAKKYYGRDVFVRQFRNTVDWYENNGASYKALICDDVRYPAEMEVVKELGFMTVYVKADMDVRLQRARKQGLEFIQDHSSEHQVRTIGGMADKVIDNSCCSKEELEYQIGSILQSTLAA